LYRVAFGKDAEIMGRVYGMGKDLGELAKILKRNDKLYEFTNVPIISKATA
jgi:hypothetical protein